MKDEEEVPTTTFDLTFLLQQVRTFVFNFFRSVLTSILRKRMHFQFVPRIESHPSLTFRGRFIVVTFEAYKDDTLNNGDTSVKSIEAPFGGYICFKAEKPRLCPVSVGFSTLNTKKKKP